MKRISILSAAIIMVALFITACDKVENLGSKKFDATFDANLDCITVGKKSGLLVPTFSGSAVINPTDDPNVNLYLNNIEGYEIQSVKATITSISQENVTIVSAVFNIHNFQHTAEWNLTNELLSTGKTITLGNDLGEWDTVGMILKDGQEFTVLITGESDFSGVTFTIKVEIETKVTANII